MSKRVLIADDSKLVRRLVKEILTSDGWQVVGEAGNCGEAVEMYRLHQPDAVTLDIIMPDSNGIQALEEILEIDPDAKIVVISTLGQTKLVTEAIQAGASQYVSKPFMPEQLQNSLRKCVEAATPA